MFQLNFEKFLEYDTTLTGISLDVTLKFSDKNARLTAKIDTGADHCIFERQFGEQLGLKIENGISQHY